MHVAVNLARITCSICHRTFVHACSREHTLRRVAGRCGILLQQHQLQPICGRRQNG